jgi:hypothetical protein
MVDVPEYRDRHYNSTKSKLQEKRMDNNNTTNVNIINVKMPFMSMVEFMVKAAIAAIPAFIILAILGALVESVIVAIIGL